MREFNYARAWRETAKPLFDALPSEIHVLLDRVTREGQGQGANLDCIWPEQTDEDRLWEIYTRNDWSGSLREAFDAIPTELLARSAAIIHDFGHWMPLGVPERSTKLQTWWFSNYADQVLRVRLKRDGWMSPLAHAGSNTPNYGPCMMILEGLLRVGYSTSDSWEWHEVALATEVNLDLMRESYFAIPRPEDVDPFASIGRDGTMEWSLRMQDSLLHDDGSLFSRLTQAGKFYMDEKVVVCTECKTARPAKESERYHSVYASEA